MRDQLSYQQFTVYGDSYGHQSCDLTRQKHPVCTNHDVFSLMPSIESEYFMNHFSIVV